MVNMGGVDGKLPPPPPPPRMLRGGLDTAPVAPASPKGAQTPATPQRYLPGSLEDSPTPRASTPPGPRPSNPATPTVPPPGSQDAEAPQGSQQSFQPEVVHHAMPPEAALDALPRDVECTSRAAAELAPEVSHSMMRPPSLPPPGGRPPPPPTRPPGGTRSASQMPALPSLPGAPKASAPSTMSEENFVGGRVPMSPPPYAPPYRAGGLGGLPPLRLGGDALPALPKTSPLSVAGAPKVPMPKLAAIGALPPPPPPRFEDLPVGPKEAIRAPESGEPSAYRKLVQYQGDTGGRLQPRPPPKKAHAPLRPTPPSGPPPAHAIIVGSPRDKADAGAVPAAKKAKPPMAKPKPPDAPPPVAARKPIERDEMDEEEVKKRMLDPSLLVTHKGIKKEPAPVPDVVVWGGHALVKLFVFGTIVTCCIFILAWGCYLEPLTVWTTHAATVVGVLCNLGLFESVKCVVVACIALVREEAIKRQAEIAVRNARKAMKAQHLQEKNRRRRRQVAAAVDENRYPAPPMMG